MHGVQAGHALGREVVDKMQHPGEVGVVLGHPIVSTPHPGPLPVRGGEGGESEAQLRLVQRLGFLPVSTA